MLALGIAAAAFNGIASARARDLLKSPPAVPADANRIRYTIVKLRLGFLIATFGALFAGPTVRGSTQVLAEEQQRWRYIVGRHLDRHAAAARDARDRERPQRDIAVRVALATGSAPVFLVAFEGEV